MGVKQLSHSQFFNVCEYIKDNREAINGRHLTKKQFLDEIKEKLGFGVSMYSAKKAEGAVGIKLELVNRIGLGKSSYTRNINRDLVAGLVRLYRKLNEEVPSSLLNHYRRLADDGK